ncbi:uncharacterized protein LOC110106055 [Dendrobium catenatum]|uniref:uncharacterized protein LOC110106055 n=1 Tax=Dendrobium catenatum TaxID=906689 RepID=UPI0009F67A78|nr:uncharacterized protein LOC110106055 [Dendrobium catenatum]
MTELTAWDDELVVLSLRRSLRDNEGRLNGTNPCPPVSAVNDHRLWNLIDRNLISAIFSTISAVVLPYVITLSTAHEIWLILETRLQPTNRSRVIQLKNELHQVQMKDKTMQQYLTQIKNLVDNIAAAGSTLDTEDIILYTFNGLPAIYNPFKIAIRTSQHPISLDVLYSLLVSEEINIQQENYKDLNPPSNNTTLMSVRNKSTRGRFNRSQLKNQNGQSNSNNNPSQLRNPPNTPRPICQICSKTGHTAPNYWNRCNLQYVPSSSTNSRAYYT